MFNFDSDKFITKVLHSVAGLATQIAFIDKTGITPIGILLDIGDGTCRDLLNNKFDLSWFNHILISHGHYDHMGGLYSFLGMKRMLGHEKKITIIYPKDSIEVENSINAFENSYTDSIPFTIKKIPLDIQDKAEIKVENDLFIKYFPVIHRGSTLKPGVLPTIPACAFQVYSEKELFKVAFSGDTGPTNILYEVFSSDVDVGFIEASHPDDSWVNDKIHRYHLTELEALEFSKYCKKSVIIHKLPPYILKK
jgi:ribonuclease BN (tRNA processing enzyme)